MKTLILKLLLLLAIIGTIVFTLDRSGLFDADLVNNHEQASWDSFYEFTEKNDIDVLLIGNSHLYTGINPNHLSCILGTNCFILAGSGVPVVDAYYSLKEALTRCSPKVVVLETFCIGDEELRKFSGGNLSNEYKSFSGRRNFFMKLFSTPVLFSSENYLSAWSTSIRNHDFIFKDPGQIDKNRKGLNKRHKKKEIELGRFSRFGTGITDETDKEYDELGPVVDGNEFRVNKENYVAVRKIEDLCDRKGISLYFFTVPMYHKHVANYSSWRTIVSGVIGNRYSWLDLQDQYDYDLFTKECFENTRMSNQHTSTRGARMCDYKLANFLIKKAGRIISDRHSELSWLKMFYGQDGYFERFTVNPEDKANYLLCKYVSVDGVLIADCIMQPDSRGSAIYMKIDKGTPYEKIAKGLYLYLDLTIDGESKVTKVRITEEPGSDFPEYYLLSAFVSDWKSVTSASLVDIGLPEYND